MIDQHMFLRLTRQNEGESLDFKRTSYDLTDEGKRADLVKDVLCMANTPRTGSAHIVLGVAKHTDGRIELFGVDEHPDDADLQSQFTDRVYPIPHIRYHPLEYEGKQFGVIEVFPLDGVGPFVPTKDFQRVLRSKQVYFRRESKNDIAGPDDLRRIVHWINHGSSDISDRPNGPDTPPWDRFIGAVHQFDPLRRYILLCNKLRVQEVLPLANVPWTAVIDFDPDSQEQGLLANTKHAVEAKRALHLVVKGDRPTINPDFATYWFFACGLKGRRETLVDGNWRQWKNAYGSEIGEQFRTLGAAINPVPVTAVVVWQETDYLRHLDSVLESAINAFGASLELVIVTEDPADLAALANDYAAELVELPLHHLLSGIQQVFGSRDNQTSIDPLLPSSSNTAIKVPAKLWASLLEEMELLHLGVGTARPENREPGVDFLKGDEVSWYELGLHYDVERDLLHALEEQVRRDLARKRGLTINLYHPALFTRNEI